MIPRTIAAVVVGWLVLLSTAPAFAAGRLALVIANSTYKDQPLKNPANDRKLMQATLEKLGFEVLAFENLDGKGMKRAIREFNGRLAKSGKDTVGLVYYSGHGVQVKGINYLVPVDAVIETEGDVEIETIAAEGLMTGLETAGNDLNIVILDACRNNPFRGLSRSTSRGLAELNAPVGSLVAFSTSPGNVAADGVGNNSPYTESLAAAMLTPGLKVEDVFKRVRVEMKGKSDGKQVPWESTSVFGEFYFVAPAPAPSAEPVKPSAAAKPEETADNRLAASAWSEVKDSGDPVLLQVVVDRFPGTIYADFAKARMVEIARASTKVKVANGKSVKNTVVALVPAKPKQPECAATVVTVATGERYCLSGGDSFDDCRGAEWCPRLVVLPAGSFTMGSPDGERGRQINEGPSHTVVVAEPMAIGKFEVTYEQWDLCFADKGCRVQPEDGGGGRGSRPVMNVSWDDAQQYLAWLRKKTGRIYRLPSEAEWEYAARAEAKPGRYPRYSWGDTVDRGRANCNGCRSEFDNKSSAPVGSFNANAFGLFDTAGNAAEWVEDCYSVSYQGVTASSKARRDGSCDMRVVRSGSFRSSPDDIRPAFRDRLNAKYRLEGIGFRVVRILVQP